MTKFYIYICGTSNQSALLPAGPRQPRGGVRVGCEMIGGSAVNPKLIFRDPDSTFQKVSDPHPDADQSLESYPTLKLIMWKQVRREVRQHWLHNRRSRLLGGSPVESLQSHMILTMSHSSSGLTCLLPATRVTGSNPQGGTYVKPGFSC